jgi:hypothetical protein
MASCTCVSGKAGTTARRPRVSRQQQQPGAPFPLFLKIFYLLVQTAQRTRPPHHHPHCDLARKQPCAGQFSGEVSFRPSQPRGGDGVSRGKEIAKYAPHLLFFSFAFSTPRIVHEQYGQGANAHHGVLTTHARHQPSASHTTPCPDPITPTGVHGGPLLPSTTCADLPTPITGLAAHHCPHSPCRAPPPPQPSPRITAAAALAAHHRRHSPRHAPPPPQPSSPIMEDLSDDKNDDGNCSSEGTSRGSRGVPPVFSPVFSLRFSSF